MRIFECPNCGADISESYEPSDPDVGIMSAGWWCEECDLTFTDDEGDE